MACQRPGFRFSGWLLIAIVAAGASWSQGAILTFREGENGYTGCLDTDIRFATPTQTRGNDVGLQVDSSDGTPAGPIHSLIRFENLFGPGPNQIPAGVIINGVQLTLTAIAANAQSANTESVHAMLQPWDENLVTWNGAFGADGIQANNLEARTTADGTFTPNLTVPFAVTIALNNATVQAWMDGTLPNNGWALLPGGTDGFRWQSSEDTVLTNRPLLTVDFAPIMLPVLIQQPAGTNVLQCRKLTLTALAIGSPTPTYRWFKDGFPMDPVANPTASTPVLMITNMQAADAGVYRVVASNSAGDAPSAVAVVTVTPDTQGPRLVSHSVNRGGTLIQLTFDEPLEFNTATDTGNYSLAPFINISGAVLTNETMVLVQLEQPMEPCVTYRLTINFVADACAMQPLVPNPTAVAFRAPLKLVSIDGLTQWRYDESGTDLGIFWRDPAYDDSAWPMGPSLFGLEPTGPTPEPIRTPLTISNTKTTFYFRIHFDLPTDPSTVTTLELREVLDDGAVYYLNGMEVHRNRMPIGPLNFATLAVNQPVNPAQYEGPVSLPISALLPGDNVLAVEVHQSSATSSDVLFGCELTAMATNCIPARPRVRITSFEPLGGGEGTILHIYGQGFHGGSPDDHCAVFKAGNRFIDIEVLTASADQLTARVGAIPPQLGGQPVQLVVGVGDGNRGHFRPAFFDVFVADDVWTWRGNAPQMAVAPAPFQIQPVPPPTPGWVRFHNQPITGGMIMVDLDKDWGVGSRFCISARIHGQGTGADTRINTTFNGAGDRFDCALRLCDVLVKAFASHPARPINVVCTVTTNGANPKLTLTLTNNAPIDAGNLDIIQKEPPPIVTGLWDFNVGGLWRREVRRRELARWYRDYQWTTVSSIWFTRRAEGVWYGRESLESFTSHSHCLYRFPDGRTWVIWRTFRRTDVVRFWVHHRFYWPGRVNPGLPAGDARANRVAMTMDDLQVVLPMTPQDPNPSTPFNEAVMIVDENGQQHFQGQPGFEVMPDVAGNPNGFQLATTQQSTDLLPPAPQRVMDVPMVPMPGMAQLQPGVIIQWLVDPNGNVLVDHDGDGGPDPLLSPFVLGNQKHQGLIAPAQGTNGNLLAVDQGNNQLQLYCWELDPAGEVVGAMPGEAVIGPPGDLNGDGLSDVARGAPIPMEPTVRELVVAGGGVQEVRNPTAHPVDIAVEEEGPPTPAQIQAFNNNMAAQIPGFVPIQPPFNLCIRRVHVRRISGIDRRFVMDVWRHHWTWSLRQHVIFTSRAQRVWLTRQALASFMSSHHHHHVGQPPTWTMYRLSDIRFFRVCYRVVYSAPNQTMLKVDQMHLVVPADPGNPNSPLMLLSTVGDENRLFQEVPPPVLAGLQPDPLPVGPDGVFVEPIDPVASTLDFGLGGAGVFYNLPLEARGMSPDTLVGNRDSERELLNNQLQLYCWALNPNGTIASDTFGTSPTIITLAVSPTPAIPEFVDEAGNVMENPTSLDTAFSAADNTVRLELQPGGGAQISWEGPGQLQAANELMAAGQTVWTDVPGGAVSPVTVTTGQMKKFYRARR